MDDEASVLAGLKRSLRRRSGEWNMRFADSVAAALAALAERQADVVVTDLMMPERDGIELARTLREKWPHTKCIVLTGSADLQLVTSAVNRADIFRIFLKPCPAGRLDEGIAEALAATRAERAPLPAVRLASSVEQTIINQLPFGVAAVDRFGHVVALNSRAGEALSSRKAIFLDVKNAIHCLRPQDTQSLERIVHRAIETGEPGGLSIVNSDGPDLTLVVAAVPAKEASAPDDPRALVIVNDGAEAPAPPASLLISLFGLTNSEARLALELVRGRSISEAAERLELTISSARTYLKAIFEKCGVNRQAELVLKLLATTASLPPRGAQT